MRKTGQPPGISGEFHSLATYIGHKTEYMLVFINLMKLYLWSRNGIVFEIKE